MPLLTFGVPQLCKGKIVGWLIKVLQNFLYHLLFNKPCPNFVNVID